MKHHNNYVFDLSYMKKVNWLIVNVIYKEQYSIY